MQNVQATMQDLNDNLNLFAFAARGVGAQKAIDDITANNHRGNVHSNAAHQKANKGADKAKSLILAQLRRSNGLSCESLESLTSLSHQTCSARCSELKRDGLILKAGTTKTKSGCSAALYKIV